MPGFLLVSANLRYLIAESAILPSQKSLFLLVPHDRIP